MGVAKYKNTSYAGYDKNNKEREALDYYATSPEEVVNILEYLNIDLNKQFILEPCCGGLHMLKGIIDYCDMHNQKPNIYATDIKKRDWIVINSDIETYIDAGPHLDVLSNEYNPEGVDYVIMNPPYSVIEPFTMKMLSIANKGILMLARLQFLEGQSRYENIFQEYRPSDIWVYTDRIACYKNGDFSKKESSAQAYCWVYFDMKNLQSEPKLHWIRRTDKKGENNGR